MLVALRRGNGDLSGSSISAVTAEINYSSRWTGWGIGLVEGLDGAVVDGVWVLWGGIVFLGSCVYRRAMSTEA